MPTRPTAFGYTRNQLATPRKPDQARRHIAQVAHQEGFALAQTYTDADANRPGAALAALIAAARRQDVRTVIVSCPADLGNNPAAQAAIRQRLQREAGLVTLVATPTPGLRRNVRPPTRVA